MASHIVHYCLLMLLAMLTISSHATTLSPNFYNQVCPQALPIVKSIVQRAILRERRMGASLLRLFFHDCFVNLGGQLYWYKVLLGRRDARTASKDAVVSNLPAPFSSFSELLSKFQSHGLDLKDLVALSGAHTIGFAKCTTFRDRIYNDTNIDRKFASSLKGTCPRTGGFNNLAALDRASPITFDTSYYTALLRKRGLLHSDQELYKGDGSESDKLVQQYSKNSFYFAAHFKASMIKMGNMKALTRNAGEIRTNCRKVNG